METVVVGAEEPAAPSVTAELVVETSSSRERHTLDHFPIVVGRYTQGGLDVTDEEQHLSRRHLEFSIEGGQLTVTVHEKARNATSVDGQVVKPGDSAPVYDGTVIVVAGTADHRENRLTSGIRHGPIEQLVQEER